MKRIFFLVAMPAMFFLAGCGMFGSGVEEINEQPRKTTFRSTAPANPDTPATTPVPQKVPGE